MDKLDISELRRQARVVGYLKALTLAGDKPIDIKLAEDLAVEVYERLTQETAASELSMSTAATRNMQHDQ